MRRITFPLGLGGRIVGLVIAATLGTGVLLGALIIERGRDILRQKVLNDNLAAVTVVAGFIAEVVDEERNGILQMAQQPDVVRAAAVQQYELAVPALRWHLATNLRLSNLSLLDASGVIRATGLTNTTSIGTANADREWYQNIVATKLPYLGAPTLSRVTQKAVVPFGTPLLGDNGKVIGVLIAGISLDAITDLLTGIGVGPNTSTALVDTRRGGIVLSHPDPLRILTPVNGADPGASQALAGGHGSVEDAGGAGPKTLAAFGTVPGFPWVVITQQPWAVAFEPVESFGRQLLTGVGGALLLAAVAGAGLALQITRPLTRLEQAARRLAGGDLTSRVNFTGRHEIGDLGRAFDVLAEGLEEQRALRERAEETLRESEFRYRMVAELGSDFSYSFRVIPDGALEREWVAGAFQRITGYDPESIAPTAGWGHMIYPEDRRNVAAFFKRTLAGQSDVYEFRMVTASGEVRWLHVASRPEWDEAHTRVERIFGAASDVTERKQLERAMEYQAWHDPLTGLPNRRMFHLRLEGGLVTARQSGRLLALLLVDLDRFKAVNDTLGHATGDMVLRTTAERMLGAVREGDTVARLGGDEFAVVLPELERAGDARTMAERLARSLNESMAAAGETISVGASIGIALFPADGPDAEELLRYADAAMYRAKRGREWPPIAAVPARDAMQAPVPSSPPAPPAA